jgi:hypothetical protein
LGALDDSVDVLEAMLVSLTVVTGQVKAMLRARERDGHPTAPGRRSPRRPSRRCADSVGWPLRCC